MSQSIVTNVKLGYNLFIKSSHFDGIVMSAISDTGPLISAFQSNSFDILVTVVGPITITPTCRAELIEHGWAEALRQVSSALLVQSLTTEEVALAETYAHHIAIHPLSKDPEALNHLGEAEVMALAERFDGNECLLLIDEQVARAVARQHRFSVTGFAGVLLIAVEEGLLTPEQVRERLELCRQHGTHYGASLIQQAYELALMKRGENGINGK